MRNNHKARFARSVLSASIAFIAAGAIAPSVTAADFALEEVVVTAQKREQSMQDVPVAVTAMNADAMKASGVDDVADLNTANPSFVVNVQQNKVSNSPARIRGIGTTGTNPAFEGAVGLYVDGVYRSRPGMVLSTFNDIGQLQILRGPQGTLFGKNTSAGALVLDSTAPSHDFEAGVDVTVGNYDKRKYSMFVNGAVSDTLALRFSALHDERDGFYDNSFTGANTTNIDTDSYKLQALFEPTDSLSIRMIADYTESDELCCYNFSGRLDPESDAANPLDALYSTFTSGAPYYDETGDVFERNNGNNSDSTDVSEDWGVSFDVNADITDSMALRSITSYREYTNEQEDGDWDFSPVDLGGDYRQLYEFETFTQEFNLTGATEFGDIGVEYVLGAFYSHEELHHIYELGVGEFMGENWQIAFGADPATAALAAFPADQLARAGTLTNDSQFDHTDEVIAFYGHFTVSLTESVNLIAGIRYSEEEKELDRTNLFGGPLDTLNHLAANQLGFLALGASISGPDLSTSIDEEELTYTAGIQWFPNDVTQIYANYSLGYKAGGISLNTDAGGNLVSINNLFLPVYPTTDAEVLTGPASDITYDPEFVDSYELGMKTEYLDGRGRLNLAIFYSEFEDIQANTFTGTAFLTYNADTATTRGMEIENTFAISESLTSTLSITWLEEAKFGDEPNENQPLLPGRDIELAPEFAGFFGLRYDNNISDDVNLYSNLNISYTGEHNLSNDVEQTDEYTLVGAAVGVRLMDEALDIQLNCSNCADKEYLTNAFTSPLQFHNPLLGNPGAPRTYQLAVSYRWY